MRAMDEPPSTRFGPHNAPACAAAGIGVSTAARRRSSLAIPDIGRADTRDPDKYPEKGLDRDLDRDPDQDLDNGLDSELELDPELEPPSFSLRGRGHGIPGVFGLVL